MRTFCTPPPSLFDTDPLEISRFGVRLANENQTFWPMENQTACGIKHPMEIKQNGNQTTNRKSKPKPFPKRKTFPKSFRKYNQTTNGKSNKREIKRPTENQNPNDFRNIKRFRNGLRNTIKRPTENQTSNGIKRPTGKHDERTNQQKESRKPNRPMIHIACESQTAQKKPGSVSRYGPIQSKP